MKNIGTQFFENISALIDEGGDEKNEEKIRSAIATLDTIDSESLDSEKIGEFFYFYGNAWWNLWLARIHADSSLIWSWKPDEMMSAVYYYRLSLKHLSSSTLEQFRRYQALTNLGSILSSLGRVVEAHRYWSLAHSYSNSAKELGQPQGMALVNRGKGLIYYAKTLYDEGHIRLLQINGYKLLKEGEKLGLEQNNVEIVKEMITTFESICNQDEINEIVNLNSFPFGKTSNEQTYRKWCLKECLFLNPLNELGNYSIASCDILHLPNLVTHISIGPKFHGLYNQLKQEYISARTFMFNGLNSEQSKHYSDNKSFLYDTLDYPLYGFAVENLKQAYRLSYSLFDKIALFINEYYKLKITPREISFKKIWYVKSNKKKQEILPIFKDRENWTLRGLYYLSKDLYEQDSSKIEVLDPEAKNLSEIRNSLEHRYLKIHSEYIFEEHPPTSNGFLTDNLAQSVHIKEFEDKTLHLLRLCREALIYLSLSIHMEEIKNNSGDDLLTAPISLSQWEP